MISANLKQRIYTSLLLLLLVFLVLNFNIILVYTLILIGVYSALEFLSISKKIFINKFLEIVSNIFFISYIFLFCFMFYFLSSFALIKLILYSLLFACIASDIGGFCFGKIFKGPKITKISPNKTYSGAFGSILFSSITLTTLIFFYTGDFDLKIILVGILVSIGCQIGDLFFSLLKRKAKLKDTGNILPGHGGVLDRLDGLLIGIPTGLLSLIIFL
tara:strand:+ start:188 stop:838 length:651 start_codon:yes stop_codon:yes gene_type:complete